MFCPNCGTKTTNEQKFCRSCGLSLEKVSEAVLEQISSSNVQQQSNQWLERFGAFAWYGFCAVIFIAVCGLIFAVFTGLILSGKNIVFGILLIAFITFGLLLLVYLHLSESFAELKPVHKSAKNNELQPAENTARLLPEPDFEPFISPASVTERTTDLLRAEKPKTTNELG